MASQTVWTGAAFAATVFAAKQYLENSQRDAEACKEREKAQKAKERQEEVDEERRKAGQDPGRSEQFRTETVRAFLHEDKLCMDLLREIRQRLEVQRRKQTRFPSIELPYLHTEGAAEDPAAAVVAVALALGLDFSRLADVPVLWEELFALESVSMHTVRELFRILEDRLRTILDERIRNCRLASSQVDDVLTKTTILDMRVVQGQSHDSSRMLDVLLNAARCTEIYFGDFTVNTDNFWIGGVWRGNKRVSEMEAVAENLGLCLRRASDFVKDMPRSGQYIEWEKRKGKRKWDQNHEKELFVLANFDFGRGFRCPVDGKDKLVLRKLKVKLPHGACKYAAPTLCATDRDKIVCFFGKYLFGQRLKVLVERLKSSSFVSDTLGGGRVSIEHIAALSGELSIIEGRPLTAMRNATLQQIKHAPKDFDRRLRAHLTECLADLTPWQRDLGSNYQREIGAFCGDYARLVEMRLHLVPHYKGCPPSQMVPEYPISQEAWKSLLSADPSSQQRRCRHILQDDETERNRAARSSGSVPLGFDLLAVGSVGPVLFGLIWVPFIGGMLPCVAGLIHWLAPFLIPWLGVGDAATTDAWWVLGCKIVVNTVFTFYVARSLAHAARLYSDVFGLDLDKHCSATQVVLQMRISTYSQFARLLGLAQPLQRTLAPLEARCIAQLHRWRANVARARFFAALKRGRISTREMLFIVETLSTAADSLRAEAGCLPRCPGSTKEEAAEAAGNLALSDGACWIPGTDKDAETFFHLTMDDTAQIEGAEGGGAPLAAPFLLMGLPVVDRAQRAGAATWPTIDGPSIAPDRDAPLQGKSVRISGLVAKPELNGVIATAGEFDELKARYEVRLGDGTRVAIKPANLTEVSAAEALSLRAGDQIESVSSDEASAHDDAEPANRYGDTLEQNQLLMAIMATGGFDRAMDRAGGADKITMDTTRTGGAQGGVGEGGATGCGAGGRNKDTTTRIKDQKQCLAAMRENGYKLVRWQGKHWVWRRELLSGRQQSVTTSKTPSDHRAYKNIQAQLARNNRDKDAKEEGAGGGRKGARGHGQ